MLPDASTGSHLIHPGSPLQPVSTMTNATTVTVWGRGAGHWFTDISICEGGLNWGRDKYPRVYITTSVIHMSASRSRME